MYLGMSMLRFIAQLPFVNFFKTKPESNQTYSGDERSNVIYSQILTLTILLFLINFFQDVFTEEVAIWGADLFMVVIVSGVLAMSLKGFHLASKVLGFILVNLALTYFTIKTGNKTQVNTLFFPAIATSFLVFGARHFIMGFAFSIVSFCLIIWFEVYTFNNFIPNTPAPKPDLGGTLINLFSSYSMLIVTIIVLIRINAYYEKNLLEEKKKLQAANEELDRFVYSMSHDLRAPLSSIKGLVQIAQKEVDASQLAQYFPMIEDRVEKLASFTEDVTNYARNIRTEIQQVPVNILEVVNEAWITLKFMEGYASVQLMPDFDPKFTLTIDKVRLKTIVNNLLSNAIKYQDYGKAEGTRYLALTVTQTETETTLQFKDNGIGIPGDQLPLLFNMFHRASYQAQGSGLGLFIVKQMTEKLGGIISVQSTDKEGTTFTLTFKNVNAS
jgi:signal transduction histidine kinase